MSDFIDGAITIPYQNENPSCKNYEHTVSHQESLSKNNKDEILKNLCKTIPSLTTDYFIQNQHKFDIDVINARLSFSNCGLQSLKTLINIKINLSKKSFQTFLTVLKNQKPFKIQASGKKNLICKLFCKSSTKNFNKMSVSFYDGTLKVLKPVTYFWQEDFNQFLNSKFKEKSFANYIKKTLVQGVYTFKPVLRQVIEDFSFDSNDFKYKAQQATKQSIYRYILKSSIQPSFQVSFGSGKYEKMECLAKEQISSTNCMTQNVITDLDQFSSHSLYLTPKFPFQNLKKLYEKEYFSSNDEELTCLKTKIQPPANRLNYGLDAKFVYNMIQLNQENKINLRRINAGGFSDISVAEVEFWYLLTLNHKRIPKIVGSAQEIQEIVTHTKVKRQQKKTLVFKSNRSNVTEPTRDRIAHQMKIVSKFKGTPSIFIPEYFKLANQQSPFSNCLIMEHLPHLTLNEYAEFNRNTISFLTKIHLACLIVHTLQILKNNGIVHMDLKPSNIIVTKKMIVKLFDFGESYSKDVCDEKYKPAFSNPYGSPEIAEKDSKMEFTQKSDIYSWGVLVWQLIFKRYPFYLPIQKTVQILRTKEYEKFIYFVPEEQGHYGSFEIMPLIRSVLLKSMDKNLKNRTFTIWLTVVLKECLNQLVTQQFNLSNE